MRKIKSLPEYIIIHSYIHIFIHSFIHPRLSHRFEYGEIEHLNYH